MDWLKVRHRFAAVSLLLVQAFYSACQAPRHSMETLEGRAAIKDDINLALNECDVEDKNSEAAHRAIALIDPIYDSKYTDNEIRMLRASAYGCKARVNFFKMIGDIVLGGGLSGTAFWETITKMFFSYGTDGRVEASWEATDSIYSTLKPNQFVIEDFRYNWDTKNPGSLYAPDRINDANIYLIFISMSTMGLLNNRYGTPNTANKYRKSTPLPWSDPLSMDKYGCSYAGAFMNMIEAMTSIEFENPQVASAFSKFGAISSQLDTACEIGCRFLCPDIPLLGIEGVEDPATDCNPCPRAMRDRTSCTASKTDPVSCAAAGIIKFINEDTSAGWLSDG